MLAGAPCYRSLAAPTGILYALLRAIFSAAAFADTVRLLDLQARARHDDEAQQAADAPEQHTEHDPPYGNFDIVFY